MSFLKQILSIILFIQFVMSVYSYFGKTLKFNAPAFAETYKNNVDPASNVICNSHPNTHLSPRYPEGDQALQKFIFSEVKYPPIMRSTCVEGRVIIKITVDKNGKPIAHEVTRGVHPSLDQEVLRVVKLIDDWIPGCFNNQPIEASFYLPVQIRLQ